MRNGVRHNLLMSCLMLLVLFVAGCAAPGSFLNPADITKPIHDGKRIIEPKVIPINAALIRNMKQQAVDPKSPEYNPPLYRVGPHDILNIFVWNHPELTIPYLKAEPNSHVNRVGTDYGVYQRRTQSGTLVDSMGYISFPFAGRIRVVGMTTNGISRIITKRLSRYIRSPKVTVRVAVYRSRHVFVMGEVRQPDMEVSLTDQPKTIMMAINEAGGINQNSSDPSHIYVIRGSTSRPIVYWLNGRSPSAMLAALKFDLEPNDIVYVGTAVVSRWSRIINQIIPSAHPFGFSADIGSSN